MGSRHSGLRLHIEPLTLKQANQLVAQWHRHHKPAHAHRFSIGVFDQQRCCHGAAITARPVARLTDQYLVAEVTRCVTDGTYNACSALYGAAARVAKGMGFSRIQTFILDSETGASLLAAGWEFDGYSNGGQWDTPSRLRLETDNDQGKQRWIKRLNEYAIAA